MINIMLYYCEFLTDSLNFAENLFFETLYSNGLVDL